VVDGETSGRTEVFGDAGFDTVSLFSQYREDGGPFIYMDQTPPETAVGQVLLLTGVEKLVLTSATALIGGFGSPLLGSGVVFGSAAADEIVARTVQGNEGDDIIRAQIADGGSGNDRITLLTVDDPGFLATRDGFRVVGSLQGGAGDDLIEVATGFANVDGGSGTDTLVASGIGQSSCRPRLAR
jgi:Ca2+-binding RTX toxin-like protein